VLSVRGLRPVRSRYPCAGYGAHSR
jgi:hypothetical protein